MSIESLTARARVLQEAAQKAQANVANLTQQLQQASVEMHTVSGHFNEVAYLLGEAQKEAGLIPAEAAAQHAAPKELEDDKVDQQVEGEAPQE